MFIDNNLEKQDEVTASRNPSKDSSSTTEMSSSPATVTTISRTEKKIILDINNKLHPELFSTPSPPPPGYLVWSDSCQIRSPDIYDSSTMKYFKRQKYEDCISKKPVTNITFDENSQKYVITIDEAYTSLYSKSSAPLDCCYQVVERVAIGKQPDRKVK